MADTQFAPLGTVSAPADWQLPSSLHAILKAAYATFNGASSAAGWWPCLQVISDAGKVVGTYKAESSVAAGGSASVSFGPFLSAATTPSSSSVLPGTSVSRALTSQTVTTTLSQNLHFDSVIFDDLGWFNPLASDQITVNVPGQFLIVYTMAWIYPATSGWSIETGVGQAGATLTPVSAQTTAVAGSPNTQSGAAVVDCAAGTNFTLFLFQASGGNQLTWIAGGHVGDVQAIPTLTVLRVGDRA